MSGAKPGDHDQLVRAKLFAASRDLDAVQQAVVAAAGSGAPLPWPLKEVFQKLSGAAQEWQAFIEDHASGMLRLQDATLRIEAL